MATNNSINLKDSGLASYDGAGTFAGRTITGTTNFIDSTNGDGVSGNPTLSVATNFEQTGMHGWNGAFVEKAITTVTSDGATITLSIEQSGGGDLTIVFSDGYYTYDTTPADTITLTAGTDTVPVINYVYILQSTKALTVSTVDWPEDVEHARIAIVSCQTAASLQTQGPYKHHQYTDDVNEASEQGHISDMTYWIRAQNATWHEGVEQTYTITTNAGSADNVILTTAVGEVLQLHENAFPAFTGTPDVYVINDSVTPYTIITDLNAALTDSTGASMSGKYFSLVIWGVVNQNTGDCKLFLNLPSGSYSNIAQIEQDVSSYTNYNIPITYKGVGFLISEWKLRHQSAASGTWTSIEEIDLRGSIPSVIAGGGNATISEFIDTAFRVFDDGDDSKELAFQCSGITTATTRTMAIPDLDGTLVVSNITSSDNEIARFDSTTGKLIQNSGPTIDDNGNIDANTTWAGNTRRISIVNNSNSANSASKVTQVVGGTAAGDLYNEYRVGSARSWAEGVDNSDTQTFKITTDPSGTVTPSTGTTVLDITSGGQVSFPAATLTENGVMIVGASGLLESLGVATNGQIPIGSTGANPVLSTITAGTNTSITNAAGSITINSGGAGQTVSITALDNTDSPYTVLSTDYHMSCDTTAGVLVVDLPNAPATGTSYVVKDLSGTADTNNITISTAGAETIDGAATFVMNTEYESVNLLYNGSSWEIF